MLVLTSTCKEWAPVTGTVTFPRETRVGEVRLGPVHVFVTKNMEINGPGAFWAYIRSFGCANRLGILIQSANLASPGSFWPYIRSLGCANRLEILVQSANLASTMAILGELLAPGAQTGIIIDFTLLQKPVCGPISVAIHPSMHASMHVSTSQSTSLWL